MTPKKQLRVERCQHGYGLFPSDGEAGYGIYAFVPNSSMRSYYSRHGESRFLISLDADAIVDLTSPAQMTKLLAFARRLFAKRAQEIKHYQAPKVTAQNIQCFGSVIEQFVKENHPAAMGWIVPHQGYAIPTGKQVCIIDQAAILSCKEDNSNVLTERQSQ